MKVFIHNVPVSAFSHYLPHFKCFTLRTSVVSGRNGCQTDTHIHARVLLRALDLSICASLQVCIGDSMQNPISTLVMMKQSSSAKRLRVAQDKKAWPVLEGEAEADLWKAAAISMPSFECAPIF